MPDSLSRLFRGGILFPLLICSAVWGADWQHVRDDTPLFREKERPELQQLLRSLSETEETELEKAPFSQVSFLQLEAQSEEYRGKRVAVAGKLLRFEFVPFPRTPEGDEPGFPAAGYYDCWVRLPDQPIKPLSVVCLSEPEAGLFGQPVEIFGYYYKRRTYSDGKELLSTPTILAKTIRKNNEGSRLSEAENPARENAHDFSEKPGTVVRERIDTPFLLQLFGLSQSEWDELGSAEQPADFPRESLLKVLSRLRQPLVENVLSDYAEKAKRADLDSLPVGSVFELSQDVIVSRVLKTTVSEEEKKRFGLEAYYLCRLKIANAPDAVAIVPQVPRSWPIDAPCSERAGLRGILLNNRSGLVLVASRIQWFPATLLGDHGFDAGTLDAVPVLPPETFLRKKDAAELPRADQGDAGSGDKRQFDLLRLTEADREPFYQMLEAASKIPRPEIDAAVAAELKQSGTDRFPVIDLFNRPQTRRCDLVRLVGNARRIDPVLIGDEEIRRRLQTDRYYQIMLTTDDSQDNPLVFCIKNIPEGLPTGGGEGFNIPISISGFFYKTWAYRKMGEAVLGPGSEKPESDWQFAPLLIAAQVDWFRPPEPAAEKNTVAPLYTSTAVFVLLALLWVYFRRLRGQRKPILFEMNRHEDRPFSEDDFPVDETGEPDSK